MSMQNMQILLHFLYVADI